MTRWTKEFFSTNRKNLGQRTQGGVVVLSGHVEVQRTADMAQKFYQESNFWYLTGINQPGWRMIYDGSRDYCWLVGPDVDEVKLTFDGGLVVEDALEQSGADEFVSWTDQEKILRQLARHHNTVHGLDHRRIAAAHSFAINPALAETYNVISRIFHSVTDINSEMADMRSRKTEHEVAAIRDAIKLTLKTFQDVRTKLTSFNYEHEIEAEFTYAFRRNNAHHAYDPIVASGSNACTLHYGANNARRQPRSAVLIDIGAEIDGYCADITRTYAWSKPTKRMLDLHGALQAAHIEIIKNIEPYMPIAEYLRMVDAIMKRHMIAVGLLNDENDSRYRKYFPHSISHGLGIDVHDSLGSSRTLEPGMVLTVEPGIYIKDEGIGLRIEDDILITDKGHENMSGRLSTTLLD